MATNTKYYSIDWLYPVFGKDISGFDSATSADIYGFYNEVVNIESKREFVFGIWEKYLHGEQIAPFDLILAHEYTKALYMTKIPYGITQAEKIKRELREKYHVETVSYTKITGKKIETFDLNGGQVRISVS
jgi:hypothetical protein